MITTFHDFSRLGTSKQFDNHDQNDIIAINKLLSSLTSEASAKAKRNSCPICGKDCTSFCSSHSVPRFVLHNIAENGCVSYALKYELPSFAKDPGIKKAGVFHLICNDCDNTKFQEYEDPSSYANPPTDKMLAQIALKDNLLMLSKRYIEKELYTILAQQHPLLKSFALEKKFIGSQDIIEYEDNLRYALKSISSKFGDSYYLCYHRRLDYVVHYAAQAVIAMVSDFDDKVINDVFDFSPNTKTQYLHVAIFPMETSSIILLFVKNGETKYRKFYRQLKKLSLDDQLAAINYIIFAYTENVYLNPKLQASLKKDKNFNEICCQTQDVSFESPLFLQDPLATTIEKNSLSHRHSIPNLLSKTYALKI